MGNKICAPVTNPLGTRNDTLGVPYVFGDNSIMGHLNTGYKHVHNTGWCYPERAAHVTLTKAAGAWAAYPTPTEIIPVNTIPHAFDMHWAIVSDISANGFYTLRLYTGLAGAEVAWCAIAFTRNGVFSQEGNLPVQGNQIPANSRVSGAISSSNAGQDTLALKIYYHTYA